MNTGFKRKLINVEIELGFLRVGSRFLDCFPKKKSMIRVFLDNLAKSQELTFNPKVGRVYGLTGWYRKHKAEPKDHVIIQQTENGSYHFIFEKAKGEEKEQVISQEEAKEILDLSGLSSAAKGDIVEDRIKELILLYGQGLLSVYKPASDTEGIDLIVVKNGVFQPIFLQVKGRYNLNMGAVISDVRIKTFNPHHTYYVVIAYFNPLNLEISDNVLLIPTEKMVNLGNLVNARGDQRYRVRAALKDTSKSKWSAYLCRKNELADKLLEKFEEIERYYK